MSYVVPGASEPLHGCSRRGIVTNCRQQQQQQQQWRGWNVWGVTSDNVKVVRIASDSCSIVYVCIWILNQWPISVQSSTVWQPIKLPPFARPIPSVGPCVCPWQIGALRKRWEIGLGLRGLDKKSLPGYSGTPSSAPTTTFSPKWGLTTPS